MEWIRLPFCWDCVVYSLLDWESMLTFNVETQYWDLMASQLWLLRIVYKYFLTISSTSIVYTYINFSMARHELLVWTELLRKLRYNHKLLRTDLRNIIYHCITTTQDRGVVRGVAGVARATPIFQLLFHKTLSPQTL